MILFFDVETTGKADFKSPYNADHQPRLVQLGMIATSEDGKRVFHEANMIVKPNGFEIPDEASSIHGITTMLAATVGVQSNVALALFSQLAQASCLIVAYNSDFDTLVVKSELHRMGKADRIPVIFSENRLVHCAMKAATNVCKIPGPYGFKWPKLIEAHNHFFGCYFDGAHDALADVRATIKVHFATMATIRPPAAEPTPEPQDLDLR